MADPTEGGGFWYKALRCAEWKNKMDFSNSGLDIKNPYDLLIGKYDFKFLCMPQWPYCRKRLNLKQLDPPPFFAVNQMLSVFLAGVMGLQHALAMTGGLVTPALIISAVANDVHTTQYLVSASLICSGIFTIIHVWQLPICFTKLYYGTGVISVIGISFTFLPISQKAISIMMAEGDTFDEAYGRILGTICCCFWLVVLISFMPPKMIRRVFPPMVSGVTIFLIGAALIKSGFLAWGGGVFCGTYAEFGMHPQEIPSCQIPKNTSMPAGPTNPFVSAPCFKPAFKPLCGGNGDVMLPFGTPQYIGLGAVVFITLIIIEIFGSPFLRNAQVIVGLLVGYVVAAVVKYEGKAFISLSKVEAAPAFTFLWVKTFPLGIYPPAILPFLIGLVVTSVECVGDITATEEASELSTTGEMHRIRISSGLLGDGFNVLWGALATTLPSTTFAQNNGVIVLTRCASRVAGISCGLWLLAFGVFAKIGGFITSIPDCVLGGMTTFLFANVCISGVKIISLGDLTRRSRFILAISVGLGLGVSLVPSWPLLNLWPEDHHMSPGLASIREAVLLILETGFSLGCVVAILLHLLLPHEGLPGNEEEEVPDYEKPSGFYDSTESTHPPAHTSITDYNKPMFPMNATERPSAAVAPGNFKMEMADMKRGDV